MVSLSEQTTIPAPLDAVWPLLSDPALVAACIPGAQLAPDQGDGLWRGSVRVKFGPTVAVFRGEATLAFDHDAKRCTIEGRGIDQRGASRALANGVVTAAAGGDGAATLLAIEGGFSVTGPLETFANAGGVHVARALLAEFSSNMARLVAERGEGRLRGAAVEPHLAAEEAVGIEVAEHQVGVGDRRLRPAAAVADRPRHRAGLLQLADVSVWRLSADDRPLERIEAPAARLTAGRWVLDHAVVFGPDRVAAPPRRLEFPTELTPARIEDSFASPDTLGFWSLPAFIEVLEQAGFSAIRHRLHFQRLLALPLISAVMALLAAGFSMRPARRGGVMRMIAGGVSAGC